MYVTGRYVSDAIIGTLSSLVKLGAMHEIGRDYHFGACDRILCLSESS
jgi:hypothetical protein